MHQLPNGSVFVTQADFNALLNYSGSLPTGTTPGKIWRRAAHYFHQEPNDEWFLGHYGQPYPDDHEFAGQIPITWKPLVIEGVPARWPRSVPVPRRPVPRRA